MTESEKQSVDTARVQLYEMMQQDTDFQDKARSVLRLGRDHLGVDAAHLTRIDRAGNHWEVIASTDPAEGRFPQGLTLDLESTYCRHVVEDELTVALHDAAERGWSDDPAFQEHEQQCYHGTRLTVDDELYGTVCFVSESPRDEPFSDADTLFAELIARLLEHELEHSKQVEETTRRTNSITVLSRVLRHNLRNEMTVVRGRASHIADHLETQTAGNIDTAPLFDSIDRIIDLSDKARKLETVVATQADKEPIALDSLFDRVVTSVSSEFPEAELTVNTASDVTISAAPSLELAVTELVKNGAKHASEPSEVTADANTTGGGVELSITDNGPGLPSQEQEVLRSGVETPLLHGSGLGLWMVYWIVSRHDGTIETTVTDSGTEVTVTLPHSSAESTATTEDVRDLQRGRDRFEAAFEESFNAMVILDDEQRILDTNEHATDLLGPHDQDILGRHLGEFVAPSFDLEAVWQDLQATGQREGEVPISHADGDEHVLEYRAVAEIIPGQHLVVAHDITERKEREQELEMKTEAMDEAPIGFTITDPSLDDNPIIYANEKFCDLTGYGSEEVLGHNCRFLQGQGTDPETVATIRNAIDAESPADVEIRNYRQDGTEFWNHLRLAPVSGDAGDVENFVGFQADVTERKERERALEESERRYRALAENFPNGTVLVFDRELRYESAYGDGFEQIGLDPASMEGKHIDEVLDGELLADLRDLYEATLQGEPQEHELWFDDRFFELDTIPVRDDEGVVFAGIAVARDVTERELRERDLHRTTERLNGIIETTPNGIVRMDAKGAVQMWNEAAETIFELPRSDAIGERFDSLDIFEETERDVVRDRLDRSLQGEKFTDLAVQRQTTAGKLVHLNVSAFPLTDHTGDIDGVLAVAEDVTDREARKQELQRANTQLRAVLDNAECAIFLKDSDSTYQMINDRAREMLGIDSDRNIEGLTDFDLFPEDIAETYRADDRRVLEHGESVQREEEVPTEKGTRTYLTVKSPVCDENDTPVGVCAVATDISGRKERERLLQRNGRFGEVSGVIGHDLRNLLE